MRSAIENRIKRLEKRIPPEPTHEDALFAEERLDRPPSGYTSAYRARDEQTLRRWFDAAVRDGIIDKSEDENAVEN